MCFRSFLKQTIFKGFLMSVGEVFHNNAVYLCPLNVYQNMH